MMRNLGIASSVLAASLAASCALVVKQPHVTVTLPAPPAVWARAFPDLAFTLVYRDAAGVARAQEAATTDTTEIPCPLSENSGILAYPRSRADVKGLLRPAGALVPSCRQNGTLLPLTWEKGPVASVMLLVSSLGRDPSLFNGPRLAEYMAREADPWNLDLAGIAGKIAEGTFSAWDIDALPQRDERISAGPGEWFLESPFSQAVAADPAGTIVARALTPGMHGLFSAQGRALLLYVGPREIVVSQP